MALDKPQLTGQILSLMTDMRLRKEVSDSEFANRLATMIDAYIKSATITVPMGIPVTTAGSPTTQNGATTATAISTIE